MQGSNEGSGVYPGAFHALEVMKNMISKNVENMIVDYEAISKTFSTISGTISKLTSEEFSGSIQQSIEAISIVFNRLSTLCIDNEAKDDCIVIEEETVKALQEIIPLVPEERREEFQEVVTPENGEKAKKISSKMVCQIITWILAILAILNHVSPDSETKEIMRAGVEAAQERNRLVEEAIELGQNFFNYIKENEIPLNEQIYAVGEGGDMVLNDEDQSSEPIDP